MKKDNSYFNRFWLLILITLVYSCSKSRYLDIKPDERLIVPGKFSDFQALMDNEYVVNNIVPSIGETAADDYYLTERGYIALSDAPFRNAYLWKDDIWYDATNFNWSYPYGAIFYSNSVLAGIEKLKKESYDQLAYNTVKGSALFVRAHSIFQLTQVFAPPFDQQESQNQLGVPMRMQSDINEKIFRSTVRENYVQIIEDLMSASYLLADLPKVKSRPSKAASFALLSRIYLVMGNYDSAYKYADACLDITHELLDFNLLDVNSPNPIPQFNKEIIWTAGFSTISPLLPVYPSSRHSVDSSLTKLYEEIDLRKILFYGASSNDRYYYRGSYDGSGDLFGGLAVDEVLLIRAECFARKNDIENAMSDVNFLLKNRYTNSIQFIPKEATTSEEALKIIISERRKELVFRGIRWMDLRRYSKEGKDIRLHRVVENQDLFFDMKSKSNTFLIPPDIIRFNPDMQQNSR